MHWHYLGSMQRVKLLLWACSRSGLCPGSGTYRTLRLPEFMRGGILFVWALALGCNVMAQSPAVQQAVDAVNTDSLVWRLERLSGGLPVDVGQGDTLILSRHKTQPGNAIAAQWIQQEFTRMGYAPAAEPFGTTGVNILAVKPGLVHPERKVILCAHYDAMPGVAVAPGADDNGSGACAVLEGARVLAGQDFGNTLVFALWDEEEQGLVGSAYHAASAFGNDEQIIAVVNMDAIGYDGNGDGLLRIHARPVGNSIAIKDSALMVNGMYGPGLPIAVNNPGATYSDHASFWGQGYGAILVIEDFDDDPNPHYHTPGDRLQYMDTAYWRGLAQLAIGTAAVMAVPVDAADMREAARREPLLVHPNPARDKVTVSMRDGTGAVPEVLDALGRPLSVDCSRSTDGAWSVDLSGLAPGTYLVRVNSGTEVRTGRLVRWP